MFLLNKFKLDWLSVTVKLSSVSSLNSFLNEFTIYFKEFSTFRIGKGLYGFSNGFYFENGMICLFDTDYDYVFLSIPSRALSEIGLQSILNFLKDYYYKVKRCDICVDTNKISFDSVMQKYLDGLYVSRFRNSSFVQSKTGKIISRTLYFGSRQSNSFIRIYEKSKEIFLKTGKKVPDFIRIEFEAKDEVARKLFDLFLKKDVKALSSVFLNYLDFKENSGKTRIYNFETWSLWSSLFGFIKKCVGASRILKTPDVMFWLKNQVSKSLYKVILQNPHYFNEIVDEGRKKFEKEQQKMLTFVFNPV